MALQLHPEEYSYPCTKPCTAKKHHTPAIKELLLFLLLSDGFSLDELQSLHL